MSLVENEPRKGNVRAFGIIRVNISKRSSNFMPREVQNPEEVKERLSVSFLKLIMYLSIYFDKRQTEISPLYIHHIIF